MAEKRILRLWKAMQKGEDSQTSLWEGVCFLGQEGGWDRVSLYQYTPIPDKIQLIASSDAPKHFQLLLDIYRYPEIAMVREEPQFFSLSRVSQALFPENVSQTLAKIGLKSLHGFPIFQGRSLQGVLVFKSFTEYRSLPPEEVETLKEACQFLGWGLPRQVLPMTMEGRHLAKEVYRQFFLFLESVFLTFLICDYQGTILYVKGPFLERLGYKQNEVMGKSITHFLPHKESVTALEILNQFRQRNLLYHTYHYHVLNAQGKSVEVQAFALQDPLGRDHVLVGLAYPMDKEIFYHHDFYRNFIWDDPEMAYILDRHDRYIAVNKKLCQVTGYTEAEFYADDFPGLSVPEEKNLSRKRLLRVLEGERLPPRMAHLKTKDGRILAVEVKVYPIRNTQGEVVAVMGVLRELIQDRHGKENQTNLEKKLKTLEEAYQRIQKESLARKQFMQSAAHFLKTPLAIIRTALETLSEEMSHSQKQLKEKVWVPAFQALTFMEDGVNYLLEITMLRDGQVKTEIKKVFLKPFIEKIWQNMELRYNNKHLQLINGLDDHHTLTTDPTWFAQALGHILENMAEKSPEKGKITISFHREDKASFLRLMDEGPGVQEKQLSTLFIPFLNPNTSTRKLHHGLGLPLAYWIVDALGGDLTAHNHPQGGMVFEIRFPGDQKSP